jgi:hypothetical protein
MGIPGDDLGTAAQDILYGDFSYDAAQNQLVYTLTMLDLSTTTTNMRWTMSSDFGPTTVFVGLRQWLQRQTHPDQRPGAGQLHVLAQRQLGQERGLRGQQLPGALSVA